MSPAGLAAGGQSVAATKRPDIPEDLGQAAHAGALEVPVLCSAELCSAEYGPPGDVA